MAIFKKLISLIKVPITLSINKIINNDEFLRFDKHNIYFFDNLSCNNNYNYYDRIYCILLKYTIYDNINCTTIFKTIITYNKRIFCSTHCLNY